MAQGSSWRGPMRQGSVYRLKISWPCSISSPKEKEGPETAKRGGRHPPPLHALHLPPGHPPGEQVSKLRSPQKMSKATTSPGCAWVSWKSCIQSRERLSCTCRMGPSAVWGGRGQPRQPRGGRGAPLGALLPAHGPHQSGCGEPPGLGDCPADQESHRADASPQCAPSPPPHAGKAGQDRQEWDGKRGAAFGGRRPRNVHSKESVSLLCFQASSALKG